MYTLESLERELSLQLYEHILSFPNLQAKIRYKIPFFYGKSWICYLNPLKVGGVEMAFLRANELSNIQGALDFKMRKQVAGITFQKLEDLNFDLITEILVEAIDLDMHVPYNVRKKK